ncbi:electron transfer flavoprotein subunit alpha, mitochondrial-like protein [Ramicandelaber brevisporus]|nr:electron transfer flavoprotein subunit alpha, mitochondrial-like protein [Ramicandelaber brevisporus]
MLAAASFKRFSSSRVVQRAASTLVLVEHKDGAIAASTLNALAAASKIGGPVSALVAGGADASTDSVSSQVSKLPGVSKVLVAKNDALAHGVAESTATLLARVAKAEQGLSHVVAPHTAFGKNVLPRAAALLDVAPVSDVTEIVSEDTFVRPIYAGNAVATVQSADALKLLTVRTTAFQPTSGAGEAAIDSAPAATTDGLSTPTQWIKEEISKSDRPELASAKRVVSGGRAVKSAEGFNLIYELADKMGAAAGASRAAVDAGYCDNTLQVGQTGKIVAPELYIAIGISGAIQHVAGMKDSKVIVAINKDAEAPIFQIADYGLVGDLFKIVPELTEKISK